MVHFLDWNFFSKDLQVPCCPGGHAGICGLRYHWRPRGYLWFVLLLKTTLMSIVHVASGGHIGVYGLVLPLRAMLVSVVLLWLGAV